MYDTVLTPPESTTWPFATDHRNPSTKSLMCSIVTSATNSKPESRSTTAPLRRWMFLLIGERAIFLISAPSLVMSFGSTDFQVGEPGRTPGVVSTAYASARLLVRLRPIVEALLLQLMVVERNVDDNAEPLAVVAAAPHGRVGDIEPAIAEALEDRAHLRTESHCRTEPTISRRRHGDDQKVLAVPLLIARLSECCLA